MFKVNNKRHQNNGTGLIQCLLVSTCIKKKKRKYFHCEVVQNRLSIEIYAAWKVSVFGVILVRIFSQEKCPYSELFWSAFSRMKSVRIWSYSSPHFLAWKVSVFGVILVRIFPHEKCPYSELFWSTFSRIWTEYGKIRSIFYAVLMII